MGLTKVLNSKGTSLYGTVERKIQLIGGNASNRGQYWWGGSAAEWENSNVLENMVCYHQKRGKLLFYVLLMTE